MCSNKKIYNEAENIKILIMSEYRFGKQYKYVASECHHADVLVSNGKHIYEFEVKISKSDLKKELTCGSKIKKHKFYKGELKKYRQYIRPNRFYYVVPYSMLDSKDKRAEIIEIINTINSDYGLIAVYDNKFIQNIRLAKMLHNIKVKSCFLEKIVARVSSENIGLKKKIYEYKLEKYNKKDTD